MSIKESIFLAPVTRNELYLIINKLNKYKAPGHDKINPELVKITASVLADPLVHIYNLSFVQGVVPEKLKVAKVIPVFKKGDHTERSNYRPISLLSIFDKLLEKLMYAR